MSFSTFPKRSYVGNAVAGTLASALTSTSTSFASSTSLAFWTDVTGGSLTGQLVVAVEYGTANEEKIGCVYNGTTFTSLVRNFGGETNFPYTTSSHPAGSTFVVVWSAFEAAEVQVAVQALAKNVLTNTGSTTTGDPIVIQSTPAATGTSQWVAAADHSHNLNPADLNTWLSSTSLSGITIPAANVQYGVNNQSGSYTVLQTDASNIVVVNNTSSATITLPSSFTAVGQSVTIVGKTTNPVTITGPGVFSTGATSGSPILRTAGSVVTAIYLGSASWVVTGDIS